MEILEEFVVILNVISQKYCNIEWRKIMKENLYDRLGELLKTKEEYRSEDGELLKAKVHSDIMTMNKNLISLLLSDEEVKKAFFLKVDDTLVFDKQKFAWIIDSKEFLPDSYTAYTNKIGLTSNGDFISQKNEVVLDFPYKDCVLEGGQTKDDQNRKEIFYNETLAQDEIRRMLDPKVFTKAKRYTKDGVEENISFNEKDNLIIKGNNLVALSSLLERYEGQVKCIYIDPPYNTGSDSFNYNDNFNHSSWLTFMKNRLEIAKKLLTDDGVIFVQCDYNEQAYLGVLLDNIFGRINFVNQIIWKRKFGNANETRRLGTAVDYIFLYQKSEQFNINDVREKNSTHVKEYIKSRFTRKDEDGPFKGDLWMPYPLANPGKPTENLIYTYKGYSAPPKGWRMVKSKLEELDKQGRLYFPESKKQRIQEKKFLKEYEGQPVDALWTDIFVINSQAKEALNFDGQKPEQLIQRILLLSTDNNDLVLDFHLGSCSTAAVAHKMGRRYIGIEQMDYIEDITIERLKKVIDGEQGGISKSVNWQGGGSFVYCELMENGNELIREIENANENTVKDVKAKIYKDERIVPYITTEELEKVDEDFEDLNLEDKKKALIKLVDKNKLYVNYSDIDSADFNISEADKRFTKSFYEVD